MPGQQLAGEVRQRAAVHLAGGQPVVVRRRGEFDRGQGIDPGRRPAIQCRAGQRPGEHEGRPVPLPAAAGQLGVQQAAGRQRQLDPQRQPMAGIEGPNLGQLLIERPPRRLQRQRRVGPSAPAPIGREQPAGQLDLVLGPPAEPADPGQRQDVPAAGADRPGQQHRRAGYRALTVPAAHRDGVRRQPHQLPDQVAERRPAVRIGAAVAQNYTATQEPFGEHDRHTMQTSRCLYALTPEYVPRSSLEELR